MRFQSLYIEAPPIARLALILAAYALETAHSQPDSAAAGAAFYDIKQRPWLRQVKTSHQNHARNAYKRNSAALPTICSNLAFRKHTRFDVGSETVLVGFTFNPSHLWLKPGGSHQKMAAAKAWVLLMVCPAPYGSHATQGTLHFAGIAVLSGCT